ncbi:MAG: flavodoxin [Bacteroidales bacterium]|nr:flavodoxin [Bacteroidales bacterium]
MKKTILMYWPTGGNVEFSAKLIQEKYEDIEVKSIDKVSIEDLQSHDQYIIGCSTVGSATWDSTDNKDPWPSFLKELDDVGITSKTVALFGLGDQIRWPKHYVDGMAVIYDEIHKRGAKIIGRWEAIGYEHEESEAQVGDSFCGLALDQDQQADLSEERVEKWVKQLKEEFV